MVIYIPLNEYCLSGNNSRNLILDLHNEKRVSIQKELQENITNKYVFIFDNLQQFSHWGLY